MSDWDRDIIERIDHVVLTVDDIQSTCTFYRRVMGMRIETFGEGRQCLRFGEQKINLHAAGREFEPKAARPTPGSADLCFLTRRALSDWQTHLAKCGVEILDGPVQRTGATGPIISLYFRDPDGNLIEVSEALY